MLEKEFNLKKHRLETFTLLTGNNANTVEFTLCKVNKEPKDIYIIFCKRIGAFQVFESEPLSFDAFFEKYIRLKETLHFDYYEIFTLYAGIMKDGKFKRFQYKNHLSDIAFAAEEDFRTVEDFDVALKCKIYKT